MKKKTGISDVKMSRAMKTVRGVRVIKIMDGITKKKKGKRSKNPPKPINDIEFNRKLRGYNRAQVDHYIEALTKDYNVICKKCDELDEENEALRRVIVSLNGGQS